LFYGYTTGVFSSRKIEQATYDSIPFRFITGGLHPDHDTIANFRKTFLAQIIGLFAQVLVVAHELGYVNLGNISLDGSKLRADASKHQAVSYGRLLELEQRLRAEVAELLALGEQADQNELPPDNFTDPDSRIMKNPTDEGFDQYYNAQAAVDQESLLIVRHSLSNHPNDKAEALPTVKSIPSEIGKPEAAALDNGYFSPGTIQGLEERGIEPYIATGREAHHHSWQEFFVQQSAPPPENASPIVKMAYKLQTEIGKAIYRLRKCTVEPVIGIIKETLGFRQFSLRGTAAVAGEWCLVCLAYDLKRLHTLMNP
jgi:hypothetical protein